MQLENLEEMNHLSETPLIVSSQIFLTNLFLAKSQILKFYMYTVLTIIIGHLAKLKLGKYFKFSFLFFTEDSYSLSTCSETPALQ